KHEGISFLMFDMESPGVTTRPITLINGGSPFCETFFDNVQVPKSHLLGSLNQGWSIGKRLLQHERSGLAVLANGDRAGPLERILPSQRLDKMALSYTGSMRGDPSLRNLIVRSEMEKRAFLLTQKRALEESESETPGAATSIFKVVEANYVKAQLELQLLIRGSQGLGWEGDAFTEEELTMCRLWLEAKSISIAGGSNEIQFNIIAKRVLGLPD
ncbi:MAG: acyl-CoA dehydrogenase family protein, partial [Pseudomonadales bacterium]